MKFSGIVPTASVAPTHGGGRKVDLTAYRQQIDNIVSAPQTHGLVVELGEGDKATTIRNHFIKAAELEQLAQNGLRLTFRKIYAQGKAPAKGALIQYEPSQLLVCWEQITVDGDTTASVDTDEGFEDETLAS